MALVKLDLVFFFLCHCLLLLYPANSKCQQSFSCKNLTLAFPFTDASNRACGLFTVDSCDSGYEYPTVNMGSGQFPQAILGKISENKFIMRDIVLQTYLNNQTCPTLSNMSLTNSPSVSFTFSPNLTLFTCYKPHPEYFQLYESKECEYSTVYYKTQTPQTAAAPAITDLPPECSMSQLPKKRDKNSGDLFDMTYFQDYESKECEFSTVYNKTPQNAAAPAITDLPPECSMSQLPKKGDKSSGDLFDILTADFVLEWSVSDACYSCHNGGGQCLTDNENQFYCKQGKEWLKRILAISISGAGILLLLSVTYIIWVHKRRRGGCYLLSRNMSSNPSEKSEIEGVNYFGIPVFSYTELEAATNHFDPSEKLGVGGFGTVYHGKLEDGREVAIKRLHEHNYRRVEQFLNEIKILTCLRHPNLVSLYGCTSRRSRELLLVYEYISNGTVGDHLHGERAKKAPLTWPIRMNIAIETAIALAYLHNADIIHRDVKTNNILLDSNFCVKVADFGLSRLFPIDVTHISTAPQGTPGYVDPDYHQCYQLTDKSDVYSFGVVLIELISSMPAVDVSRHRHEINLANLAMNRIQRCAFDELIDPSLRYGTDPEVTRMTTSVAELAFRCLQQDKDLRPSMDEVVCSLQEIQGGEDCDFEQMKGVTAPGRNPPSPETDNAVLLKNTTVQSSPTAVTDTWISSASTTANSIV